MAVLEVTQVDEAKVKTIVGHIENVEREINYAQAQLAQKRDEMNVYISMQGKEQNCTTARAMKTEMVKLEEEVGQLVDAYHQWADQYTELTGEEIW